MLVVMSITVTVARTKRSCTVLSRFNYRMGSIMVAMLVLAVELIAKGVALVVTKFPNSV